MAQLELSNRAMIIVVTLGVLGLLGAGAFGLEAWRQADFDRESERLEAAIGRVNAEILHHRTPREFYAERASGVNGWPFLSELLEWAEPDASQADRADWSYIQRVSDHMGQNDLLSTTDPLELRDMLDNTEAVARAFRRAAATTVIAPVTTNSDDEVPFPEGVAVIPLVQLYAAALARVEILAELDMTEQAEAELIALARTCAVPYRPALIVDLMIHSFFSRGLCDSTLRLLEAHRISPELALQVVERRNDPIKLARSGYAGDLAFVTWLIRSHQLQESGTRRFAWLRAQLEDDGYLMDHDKERGALAARFMYETDFLRGWAAELERSLEFHELLGNGLPISGRHADEYAAATGIRPVATSNPLYRGYGLLANALLTEHTAVAIEYEARRQLAGDDFDPRAVLEEIISRFPYTTLTWDGDVPVLGLKPIVSGLTPGKDFQTRIEPR